MLGKVINMSYENLCLQNNPTICDRTWEKGPLRAQYDFSVQAFLVEKNNTNVKFFFAKLVS